LNAISWHVESNSKCTKAYKQTSNNLGEVSNKVTTSVITSCQNIEVKRFHVVVERLVVKEEFRQQTKVLTIDL